jgi:hypothetical protein
MRTQHHLNILAEIEEAMSRLNPPTLEEANAVAQKISDRNNNAARIDFCGLSPALMVRFLHFPLESPDLIDIPTVVDASKINSRLATIFLLLTAAIGEKGIKATVTGNLPLSVVRSVATDALLADELEEMTRYGAIRTEKDFRDLHLTRSLAEISGMIRKVKGRFTVTKGCEKLQARSGMAEIYPRLFKAFVDKLNWGYLDYMPNIGFIQSSFAFTYYLLSLFGNEWRPPSFYEDAFLKAFPRIVDDIGGDASKSKEEQFKHIYRFWIFEKYADLLGIIETQTEKVAFIKQTTAVKKTNLLGELIRFHI